MSLWRNCPDSYVWTFRKDTGTLEHWLGAVPSACLLSFACKMVKEFLLIPEKSIILSWSRHTNLIDELVYLFFLLTVLAGVKIFRPVFITAPPSGLNRKCIHNPQNGSKLGPKRFKNYFFRIFFGEFLTIIDAATCACQQLDDLPTPIEILIISCFKTHLPLADKERIRRLRGATKTWWWQVVTFISARQFSVCCLIFVTYATYGIGVGFLLRCEKIPK